MAAASLGSVLASCTPKVNVDSKRNHENLGIQLYTVRDLMAIDVPNTLSQLANIGYREMEFAGYFKHSPKEIRLFLDDYGLRSPSMHTNTQSMLEIPDQLIEDSLVVGHKYIVLAGLRPEERATLDDYRRHVDLINSFAEKCHAAGLQFAYHNHAYEFEYLEGFRPIDLLLSETDPSLMKVEIDFYWVIKAGVNPIEYFEKYPGRFPLCHVKDMANDGSMTDVGAGEIDFRTLFSSSLPGLKHFFVEHDDPIDSMLSASSSYSHLSKLDF
ncbi:MAG: xylose isomerase [Gammaproteobacteria bacterium]|nr:xylose isomerase [Gammaproteobacteria bacterium]